MGFSSMWYLPDHRTDQFPLISFPPVFVLFSLYLTVVYFAPKFMKSRTAFSLKWIIVFYNVLIVLLNFYIAAKILFTTFSLNYNWLCQPLHSESTNPDDKKMVEAIYLYFLSKPIEWLDTIFAIFRKKSNQTSFLHVYHHSSIFLISWVVLRYTPSGHPFFSCLLNSSVHVVMYTYYCLASFGPKFQKYLWWKRYLTQMQLVQFAFIIAHAMFGATIKCGFPVGMIYFLELLYPASLIFLFAKFYQQTYKPKSLSDNCENNKKGHSSSLNQFAENTTRHRIVVPTFSG